MLSGPHSASAAAPAQSFRRREKLRTEFPVDGFFPAAFFFAVLLRLIVSFGIYPDNISVRREKSRLFPNLPAFSAVPFLPGFSQCFQNDGRKMTRSV